MNYIEEKVLAVAWEEWCRAAPNGRPHDERLAMRAGIRAAFLAAPLTRVEATAPSPIQAEPAGSNNVHFRTKRADGTVAEYGLRAAALPLEAAPSARHKYGPEVHCPMVGCAVCDAPPSALDVAYPTITRLADLSSTTVGYQLHELVREAVECLRALKREHARAEESFAIASVAAVGLKAAAKNHELAEARADAAEKKRDGLLSRLGGTERALRRAEARIRVFETTWTAP